MINPYKERISYTLDCSGMVLSAVMSGKTLHDVIPKVDLDKIKDELKEKSAKAYEEGYKAGRQELANEIMAVGYEKYFKGTNSC